MIHKILDTKNLKKIFQKNLLKINLFFWYISKVDSFFKSKKLISLFFSSFKFKSDNELFKYEEFKLKVVFCFDKLFSVK